MTVQIFDILERRLNDPTLLDAVGARAVSLVQNRINKGNFAANSPLTIAVKQGTRPLKDSGQLLSSITHREEGSKAIVGSNHPAASILQTGGTIRPKTARFLTLPASAKTRSLMRTYGLTPRTCIAGMKAAGWNVWFYIGNGGSPVLLASFKKRVPMVLFILKRSLTIPARPYMTLDPAEVAILSAFVSRRLFA